MTNFVIARKWFPIVWLVVVNVGLVGCQSAPKLPERVLVPTPVSCLSAPPPEVPALTAESALLAMDEYAATLTVWAERLELRAGAAKAEALLLACR